ncbi:MmgE/PrpD family protein [Chloroflexota bacterium]
MTTGRLNLTGRLAKYVSTLKYDDLPTVVVQQAKKVILDGLACQVACSQLENGRLIIQFGRALGGRAEASVVGSNYKTSMVNAALVNGTLGHGDEIDEVLLQAGHPSAVIVSASLACGEKESASGKEMITAVVAGYDLAGGIVNTGVTQARTRAKCNVGLTPGFWAAAAAGSLMKLTLDKMRVAFGITAVQAGGFYDTASEAKHMTKSMRYGIGARNGTTAALLAQIGYDGPRSVFDDNGNMYNMLKAWAGENYEPEGLTKNLGKQFTIIDTSFKLYAAGHVLHSSVYGLLKILDREGISAEDIKSIIVRLAKEEKQAGDTQDMPEININYCLAVAAFDRQLGWDQYTPERLKDAKVADLKSRVLSVHDPKLDERKKTVKARPAEVEIETKDGRKFLEKVDYPPGEPRNPASQEDITKKAMYYASKVLGQKKAKSLIEAVSNLETIPDVNQLGSLVRIREQK